MGVLSIGPSQCSQHFPPCALALVLLGPSPSTSGCPCCQSSILCPLPKLTRHFTSYCLVLVQFALLCLGPYHPIHPIHPSVPPAHPFHQPTAYPAISASFAILHGTLFHSLHPPSFAFSSSWQYSSPLSQLLHPRASRSGTFYSSSLVFARKMRSYIAQSLPMRFLVFSDIFKILKYATFLLLFFACHVSIHGNKLDDGGCCLLLISDSNRTDVH